MPHEVLNVRPGAFYGDVFTNRGPIQPTRASNQHLVIADEDPPKVLCRKMINFLEVSTQIFFFKCTIASGNVWVGRLQGAIPDESLTPCPPLRY